MTTSSTKTSLLRTTDGTSYLFPFILITSLFFLWGFAHSLLDVLNKHFQEVMSISRAMSGLVQASVYGGYFLMAIPAGLIMKRFGYKRGIVFGLLLYAAGAFLFLPATYIQTFWAFLIALFIIACGLTCLETAANPYTTMLGPSGSSERRINLSQSFNGLGWIVGPLVGSMLIFGTGDTADNKFASLALPYVGVGFIVLLVAILFIFTRLPEISSNDEHQPTLNLSILRQLFTFRHFRLAVVTQLFYVAAQTGINSFFINYVTETMPNIATDVSAIFQKTGLHGLSVAAGQLSTNEMAGYILAFGGMGLFMIGRFTGSFIMAAAKPNILLSIYAAANIILLAFVSAGTGWFPVISLFTTYFFMSIMFPTIFALGIKDLGPLTKNAASFIVMAIVGGAICPILMGFIADVSTMQIGFLVPLGCFFVVLYYGLTGYKIQTKP